MAEPTRPVVGHASTLNPAGAVPVDLAGVWKAIAGDLRVKKNQLEREFDAVIRELEQVRRTLAAREQEARTYRRMHVLVVEVVGAWGERGDNSDARFVRAMRALVKHVDSIGQPAPAISSDPGRVLPIPSGDDDTLTHLESDWHATGADVDPAAEHHQAHDRPDVPPRRPHVHRTDVEQGGQSAPAVAVSFEAQAEGSEWKPGDPHGLDYNRYTNLHVCLICGNEFSSESDAEDMPCEGPPSADHSQTGAAA